MHVGGHQHSESPGDGNDVAQDVDAIHAPVFAHNVGRDHESDDERDVDGPGEGAQEAFVTEDVLHEEDTHVEHGREDLREQEDHQNNQVVLVGEEDFGRFQ